MDVSEKSYYASKGIAYVLVVGLAIGMGIPVIFAASLFLFGDGRSPEGTLIPLSLISAGFTYWAASWRFKYMEFEFSDGHCPEVSSKDLADADDMERAVRVAYYRYCEFHPEVTMADVAFKEGKLVGTILQSGLRALFCGIRTNMLR